MTTDPELALVEHAADALRLLMAEPDVCRHAVPLGEVCDACDEEDGRDS